MTRVLFTLYLSIKGIILISLSIFPQNFLCQKSDKNEVKTNLLNDTEQEQVSHYEYSFA